MCAHGVHNQREKLTHLSACGEQIDERDHIVQVRSLGSGEQGLAGGCRLVDHLGHLRPVRIEPVQVLSTTAEQVENVFFRPRS